MRTGRVARCARLALLVACCVGVNRPVAPTAAAAANTTCDDQCLAALGATYWEALLGHDPGKLRLATGGKFTENNVPLRPGRALWATISGSGRHDLLFTDSRNGQVAVSGIVEEGGQPAVLLTRLRVAHGAITNIETIVGRRGNTTWLEPQGWFQLSDSLGEELAASHRQPSAALIDIANAYFDRISDSSRPTPPLDGRCNRVENGVRTTNNPDPFPGQVSPPLNAAVTNTSCEQQFALKKLGFVTRVRDRHYEVVDEAKGVVLATAIFDHDGDVRRANDAVAAQRGGALSTTQPSPSSILVGELFKIDDGKIVVVQALLVALPYGMLSAW